MRRISFIVIGLFTVSVFPSCLKDKAYLDVSNTQPIVEFGLSAANGIYNPDNNYSGAFPFLGDSAGAPSVYDTAVALVLASPQVLNDTIDVTIAIDTTQLAPYNQAEGDSLTLLPANLYSMARTVIGIPPGYRVGSFPVIIYEAGFPATHHYGLPISIVNAVDRAHPGETIVISGNSGKFMWLFER